MFVPEVAEAFQRASITALIYDPRSTGESGGTPRNEIDPIAQSSDYSDALTYLSTHHLIDPSKISIWGQSFSATVALASAALDKRFHAIIAICPLLTLSYPTEKFPKVLAKAMRDRESQLAGNPPFYLPVLTDKGENPAGLGLGADKEGLDYIVNAKERVAPNYENRTTIQTYYRLVNWHPEALWRYVQPTPVLMVIPELDRISPPEDQEKCFEMIGSERKRKFVAQGKGHLNVLSGEEFPELMGLQVEFLEEVLGGLR